VSTATNQPGTDDPSDEVDGDVLADTDLWDTDHRLLAIATQTAKLRPLAEGETL
jgi:hypothetical protein